LISLLDNPVKTGDRNGGASHLSDPHSFRLRKAIEKHRQNKASLGKCQDPFGIMLTLKVGGGRGLKSGGARRSVSECANNYKSQLMRSMFAARGESSQGVFNYLFCDSFAVLAAAHLAASVRPLVIYPGHAFYDNQRISGVAHRPPPFLLPAVFYPAPLGSIP
jgi:hypothetical protein